MKFWNKARFIGLAIFLFGFLLGLEKILNGRGLDTANTIAAPIYYTGLFIIGISFFFMELELKGMPLNDERTKKISGRAFIYSWLAVFLFVCGLVGLDAFNLLNLTVSQVLAIIFLFMLLGTYMILRYYDKKSDVE